MQVIEGIEVIHDLGLLYRDLSTANILILQNELNIKLIDFGCINKENSRT